MALNKVIYPLVVDGGMNTKTEDKLLGVGENLLLLNASLDEIGANNKRNGATKYDDDVLPSGTLSSILPATIIEHEKELLVLGPPLSKSAYSYREDEGKWESKTTEVISPMLFIEDKYGENLITKCCSSAENVAKNFRVVAYVASSAVSATSDTEKSKVVVFVQDYATNAKKIIWQNEARIASSTPNIITHLQVEILDATNPIIYVTYCMWLESSTDWEVRCKTMYKDGTAIDDVLVTTISSSASPPSPDFTEKPFFDTEIVNGKLLIATSTNSLTDTLLQYIETDGTIGAFNAVSTTAAMPATFKNLSIAITATTIYVAFVTDDTTTTVCVFGALISDLSVVFAEFNFIAATTSDYAGKVTIKTFDNDSKLFVAFTVLRALLPSPVAPVIDYLSDATEIGAIDLVNVLQINSYIDSFYSGLASKAFSFDSSDDIYFVTQTTTLNSTRYALMKYNLTDLSRVVGVFALNIAALDRVQGTAAGAEYLFRNFELPKVRTGYNNNFYYPALVNVRVIPFGLSSDGYELDLPIANTFLYRLELASEYNGINARLGENTYIAGMSLKEYDGNQLYFQSFLDIPTINAIVGAAGGLTGTYTYLAIWEFTDINGQIHRSAPSNPVTIVLTNDKCSISFEDTTDQGGLREYKSKSLILYRTTAGGTVYYRLGTVITEGLLTGFASSPYSDNQSDADLIANELLYTNGEVLENQLLPPTKYITVANNRLFAISSEDENLIYYSQPYLYGECVNFNADFLSIRVDAGLLSKTGKAMVIASLDGRIIVLKDQSIAHFYGNGPNQTGAQNDFTDPKLISSDVGCSDIKSVVTIPDGVMFKSNKGIYLLDRSLQLSYIGAQVEDYNSHKIVGSTHIIDEHKVLFMTSTETLVYDYFSKKWSIWDWTGTYLTSYRKLPIFIKSNRIYAQNKSIYTDDSAYYPLKIITPWIKLSGVQNYQRIYRMMILGQFYSAHTLIVKIYFDYDETNFETHTISPVSTDDIYQYDLSPTNQRSQAFKIELYDVPSSGTGQGYKLSNLTLVLGQKRGTFKVNDSKQY